MTNIATARRVLELASRFGVREYCLCGGSRNAPLLAVLGESEAVRRYAFAEERSAAFFALGRARATERPVAVVTTSGTAVAELLPATIEAFYSGTPLLLITADRPRRFRGTGAPQSIEQRGIFGGYAQRVDLESGAEFPKLEWYRSGPLHINVAFDEPLIDGDVRPLPLPTEKRGAWSVERGARNEERGAVRKLEQLFERWKRPLVILGGLGPEERESVRRFVLRLRAPAYAEALSGLREDESLQPLLVKSSERILKRGGFDAVLRIGGVPTLRFWRDLEESLRTIPVVSVTPLPFAGLSRGILMQRPICEVLDALRSVPERSDAAFLQHDEEMAARIEELLDREPASEPSMIRRLSHLLPPRSHVYLGNSLPIREWDLVASREPRSFQYSANRGANGIDGQLSTFFGLCRAGVPNWCVVGDLTAIYDLSAPWVVHQLDREVGFQIVIVNNGGGRIFSRVASLKSIDPAVREKFIEDAHPFRFDRWAEMWDLPYEQWREIRSAPPISRRGVIELLPDAEATRRFWRRYDELWALSAPHP